MAIKANIGKIPKLNADISVKGYVQGPPGPQGPKGDPGDDYVLTEADKVEIADIASDKIDLSAYATSEEVDSKVEAVRSDIPSKVSELTNDSGYVNQPTVNTMVTSAVQTMVQRMDAKDAEVKDFTVNQINTVIDSFSQITEDLEADMIARDANVLAEAKAYTDEHGGSVDSIDADKVHLLAPFNTDVQSGFVTAFDQVNQMAGAIVSLSNDIDDLYETKADTSDVATLVDNRVEEILARGPNVTFIGSPSYNNGVLNGFDIANYAEFPFMVDLRGKSFQIDFAITTGSNVTNQQNIIDSEYGLAVAIRSGKFVMAMSSNGSTWDYGEYVGTHALSANATYFVRVEYLEGDIITLAYSTDRQSWIVDITRTGTTNLYPKPMLIGTGDIFGTPKPFGGSINLNYANLYVDGFLMWTGVADVSAQTRLAVNLSNIDEEGVDKISDIVGANVPVLVITEDMVTVTTDSTKGVAPYSTSYGYTNITVNIDKSRLVEGLLIVPVINTKLVVSTTYRNVRIRFGTDDAWHPLMGTTAIISGSSYFTKANFRFYQYSEKYLDYGAFHLLTDSNTTYTAMTQSELNAGGSTAARTISPKMLRDNFYTKTEISDNFNTKAEIISILDNFVVRPAIVSTDELTTPTSVMQSMIEGQRVIAQTEVSFGMMSSVVLVELTGIIMGNSSICGSITAPFMGMLMCITVVGDCNTDTWDIQVHQLG